MLELLEKAQVFSLSLERIADRTGLALDEESLPQWKVEMAVEAARKFLNDIFGAMDHAASFTDREVETLSWKNLLNLEQMRGALPLAIALSLQSGRDIESLKGEIKSIRNKWVDEEALAAKKVGQRARSAGRKPLDDFLSEFRGVAAKVTNVGSSSFKWEEVRREVEELVDKYYPNFFASESLRRHVVAVLTDILHLISYTPQEVREAIDSGYGSIANIPKYSLFNYEIMRRKGFGDDEKIELIQDILAPSIAIQFYLNRISSTRAHSIFPSLVATLHQLPPAQNIDSYLPVIQWVAERPEKRTAELFHRLSARPFYEFIVTRGAVTAYGEDPFNVETSAGHNRLAEIARLMGEEAPGAISSSVAQASARRFSRVMKRFADSLARSLQFIREHWEVMKERIDPQRTPVLANIVERLGLTQEGVNVEEKISEVLSELETLQQRYAARSPELVENVLYYITSLSRAVNWALGTTEEEILKNINLLASELALDFVPKLQLGTRLWLLRPFADQAFFGPAGSHLPVRFGFTRLVSPEEEGEGRRDPMEQVVGLFISDLVNYILSGPSVESDPEVWRRRVLGGLKLLMLGDAAQEEEEAQFWRDKYQSIEDWDGVVRVRKEHGNFLLVPDRVWIGKLLPNLESLNPEKVYEKLRSGIYALWGRLAGRVAASALRDVEEVLSADPSRLARYLRAAAEIARFVPKEVSLYEPVTGGEEGRTFEEVVGVEEERAGTYTFAEEIAEKVVEGIASLVSRSIGKVEGPITEDKARNLLAEAFSSGAVRAAMNAFVEYLKEQDEEERSILLEGLEGILKEIEFGTMVVELPTGISPALFAEVFRSQLTGATGVVEASKPEEVPPEEEEIGITKVEVEEEEGKEEGGEEEKVLMKFYLLSKVLPFYSS
jgi:hypothetical protein